MSNLYFNKGDRRAIMVLSVVAVIIVAAIVLFGTNTGDSSAPRATVSDSLSHDSSSSSSEATSADASREKAEPTVFDPNTVDSVTLLRNGLRPFQVHAFLRYRQAGAVFRKPLDIARLNCLEDEDIDRLLPLIVIDRKYSERRTKYPIRENYPSSDPSSPSRTSSSADTPSGSHEGHSADSRTKSGRGSGNKFTSLTQVDLNTADTTLLKRIPGVGSYTASRIVAMRTRLGGYHSTSQIQTLLNISSDLLEWFTVSNPEIRRININTATFNQLRQHPHIGYDHARDLSRYVRLYGKIKDVQQLRSSNIFTDDELTLLQPYIEF